MTIKIDIGYTRDIIRFCELERVLLRQCAYILATTYHETAKTMRPIPEIGKGAKRPYGQPVGPYKKCYYGRGFVQLTWYKNYLRMGDILGVDLVKDPELAMVPEHAIRILVLGMRRGLFTGKSLDHYITPDKCDYVGARRIVNGTDRADMIAGYAKRYERLLEDIGYGMPDAPVVAKPAAPAPAAPQVTALSWWGRLKVRVRAWLA